MRNTSKSLKPIQKANHLFYDPSKEAKYTKIVEIDLSSIKPSISGPKRPQDLILLSDAKQEFQDAVVREAGVRGFGLDKEELEKLQTLTLRIIQKQFKQVMWPLQLSHHVPILQILTFLWQPVF